MTGLINWSIGCGKDDLPDVFTSIENEEHLCFIENDIKCKHGNLYNNHVHNEKCVGWLEDQFKEFESTPKKFRGRYKERICGLKAILESCKDTDPSKIVDKFVKLCK